MNISIEIPNILIRLIIAVIVFVITIRNFKKKNNTPQNDSGNNNTEVIINKMRQFIPNTQEKIIGFLGKYSVDRLTQSKSNHSGICVLTNDAYYFIGKIYNNSYKVFLKTNVNNRLPVKEMRGVNAGYQINTLSVITLIIWVYEIFVNAVGLIEAINLPGYGPGPVQVLVPIFTLALSAIAVIMDLVNILCHKILTVRIEFSTRVYKFPLYELGDQEIKDFYNAISINKPINQENDNVQNIQQNVNSNKSKVESLTELNQLLEKQAITQAEYETLKSEIINGNT